MSNAQKNKTSPARTEDLAAKPLGYMAAWGIPIMILLSANLPFLAGPVAVSLIVLAFAWMGTGCLINAVRCKRRHCYLSGPVFLLGAVLAGLVGFQVVDFGRDGLILVVWGTIILVFLTFIPEKIWGKYVGDKPKGDTQ